MSVQATLAYSATASGPTTPAALAAAMAAIDLDLAAIETVTGCTLISDVTTTIGQTVTRTIIFDIDHAQFYSEFPPGTDQAAPFRNLYTDALALGLSTVITAAAVVLA